MAHLSYQQLIDKHLEILRSLQYDSGLFSAADKRVSTGYDKSWLRDNFYETIAFEVIGDWGTVEKTYRAILDILKKHETKIDWAIENKPTESYQYIHARFHPLTFDEFWESWGNKQNDAVGCILFRIGELEARHKGIILKNEDDVRIVNKLVSYLESIEYWKDRDSGMWEEDEEVHASSVGACVAGLVSISKIEGVNVSQSLIDKGKQALNDLLPRESDRKFVDLALLSLIWPYDVVNNEQADQIIENVEYHLLRERGVIRYKGDQYYNRNPDTISEEAEWTFGLAWLAIIHEKRGEKEKAFEFIKNLIASDTPNGMPELYFSNSPEFNDNTPLGWSESLFIVALYEIERRKVYARKSNPLLTDKELLSGSVSQLEEFSYEKIHAKLVGNLDLNNALSKIQENDGKMVYAVDMGGNKIAGQIFQASDGGIEERGELMIDRSGQGEGYVEFLEKAADIALKNSLPVGLSVAGVLNGTHIDEVPNMSVFKEEFETLYKSDFAKLFHDPTVNNDAVAGLIAGWMGSMQRGNGAGNILFIICGSGVGGALLKKNEVFAMEPGHVFLADDLNEFEIHERCKFFNRETPCIEKVASGKVGIEQLYKKLTGKSETGQNIAILSEKDDAAALKLYDHSARMIGIAVKGIFNSFSLNGEIDTTAIVFHGGVFDVPGYPERVEQYLGRELGTIPNILYTKDIYPNACLVGAAISALISG